MALLGVTAACNTGGGTAESSCFSAVGNVIIGDIMTAAMVLVPAMVILSALHKLTEHRESSGALLIEMLIKAGGAFLVILLIRTVFGF